MNSSLLENDDLKYRRLHNYKQIITDQILLAKYEIPLAYSDSLSYKEREVYMDVIKELFIDK